MLIDDFSSGSLISALGTRWRGVSDVVMGGVSLASVQREVIDERACLRLRGEVRLENNGGFVQAALDLMASAEPLDVSDWTGVRVVARGNDEYYSVHLRTRDTVRSWQSYRARFLAGLQWQTFDIPFASLVPYRLDTPFDASEVRRIGLVAIGRPFHADLAVAEIRLYR